MHFHADMLRLWPAEPDAYLELTWWQKRCIDLRIHARNLCTLGAIRALLIGVAIELATLSIAWHFDLDAWRRDLPRLSATLYFWSWLALARRRRLVQTFAS